MADRFMARGERDQPATSLVPNFAPDPLLGADLRRVQASAAFRSPARERARQGAGHLLPSPDAGHSAPICAPGPPDQPARAPHQACATAFGAVNCGRAGSLSTYPRPQTVSM